MYDFFVRCLTCHYDLRNLTEGVHHCPECGRWFDSNDPATFVAETPIDRSNAWDTALVVGIVVFLLLIIPLMFFLFVRWAG